MIRSLLSSLALLALVSCQSQSVDQPEMKEATFFDLKAYFQGEVERLENSKPMARKQIRVNEQTEEKTGRDLNFSEELKAFIDSDINRTAWLEKYRIDSSFQDPQTGTLTYTALEEKLKTQKITIDFQESAVTKIHIQNHLNTAIAKTKQELLYEPTKGYQIQSFQDIRLSSSQNLAVEVSFQGN